MVEYLDGAVRVEAGDFRSVVPGLAREGVMFDAVVTDPPYHIGSLNNKKVKTGFAGNAWDGGRVAFDPHAWKMLLAVMRPGAHLVAFGYTRNHHRMWTAIEDAGFEIRDAIFWLFGTGVPKTRDYKTSHGWSSSVRPGAEVLCLARKPGGAPDGILGKLNCAACEVEGTTRLSSGGVMKASANHAFNKTRVRTKLDAGEHQGRWPTNVVTDGSEEVLACVGEAAVRANYVAKSNRKKLPGSKHSTVKNVDLMRWLVRLVTPPGGLILDPFAGTGTTGEAAYLEGLRSVLVEREKPFLADIGERMRLVAEAGAGPENAA